MQSVCGMHLSGVRRIQSADSGTTRKRDYRRSEPSGSDSPASYAQARLVRTGTALAPASTSRGSCQRLHGMSKPSQNKKRDYRRSEPNGSANHRSSCISHQPSTSRGFLFSPGERRRGHQRRRRWRLRMRRRRGARNTWADPRGRHLAGNSTKRYAHAGTNDSLSQDL